MSIYNFCKRTHDGYCCCYGGGHDRCSSNGISLVATGVAVAATTAIVVASSLTKTYSSDNRHGSLYSVRTKI